ncbi:RHS repeat-associated core domain-containing protein [uncultured Dysgonomonas sp.]|uniref:RHS repeat-associated core domain-containing protein n=1 Tax=uncultured Dysgonomonas sp. TaxID=206096 RepID=UPI0025EB434C|nr:RHS repeat-associated core domain-containing protein [uncultured Dysgonomonas sp.]
MLRIVLYDYSARYYESAVGRFTSIDPHAEKYYSISPYAYCYNNPLKYIDPNGNDGILGILKDDQ